MVTFPVGAGTSGHLLGGALAAVLAGPWLATLALSVVLIVQAFLFADGGITALGSNVVLMALVGVWVGWFAFRLARAVLPRSAVRLLQRQPLPAEALDVAQTVEVALRPPARVLAPAVDIGGHPTGGRAGVDRRPIQPFHPAQDLVRSHLGAPR